MFTCPHCNEKLESVQTTYEIADEDGYMLKDNVDDNINSILEGKDIIETYDTITCPHCDSYLGIKIKMKVEKVEIDIIE